MASSEGDISRENLERHGIIYDETVYTCDHVDDNVPGNLNSSLPDHVDALREALLNFSGIIPSKWEVLFDDEFAQYDGKIFEKECIKPPATAYFPQRTFELRSQRQRLTKADENMESCKEIADAARRRTKEAESGWNSFLRKKIFGDFDEGNKLRTEIEQEDFLWSAFQHWQESNPNIKRRTDPKPDLTYGFPIISSPRDSPKGFIRDEYIQSFSLNVLGELLSNGVQSATTMGLRRWTTTKKDDDLRAHDVLCYPWAIVEMKHFRVSPAEVNNCYCQAANASSAALSLQEHLLVRAYGAIPKTLSPIIAFTCIGPRIKVWLTYRWETSEAKITKMSCIWSTSLELTWGVVVLQHIVQSMHFWSSRVLKPKIAAAIIQIRRSLDTTVLLPVSTPQCHGFLPASTFPATPPSSRNYQRSRHTSPSVQSRQAGRSNTDDSAASASSSAESIGTEDENSKGEGNNTIDNENYISEGQSYSSDDQSYSGDDEGNTNGSENVAFNDQTFSSDDESEYTPSETSETESETESEIDGEIGSEMNSEMGTDDGDNSDSGRIGFKYTDEELKDRRHRSLTILPGFKFAELSILGKWFEDLPFKQRVNVILKLWNPSNGGLLLSNHTGQGERVLNRLIIYLNMTWDESEPDEPTITKKKLGEKSSRSLIHRRLSNMRRAEILTACLRDCLSLHNDRACSVHQIIVHDLETLSHEDLEEMERQAFELFI